MLVVRKDGSVENDGTLTHDDTGEKTVLRKIYDAERLQKLAALHDFVEWRPGVLEEHPDEQILTPSGSLLALGEWTKSHPDDTMELCEPILKSYETR
ncbi:MAG TPA: hypothetical protein VFV38_41165 [Ktedonobacteraceae bacterium]|nr:hypothetical protein [Ktedonobacteraceae bacterium]